jgi:hypothetical protein
MGSNIYSVIFDFRRNRLLIVRGSARRRWPIPRVPAFPVKSDTGTIVAGTALVLYTIPTLSLDGGTLWAVWLCS